ncbi:MAG: transketolase [Clostridiales bacterium]|jgi:transketolase|nr:transketolase [Clostridiales bacterium]
MQTPKVPISIDTLSVNTIRLLCAEAIQEANSGHPGLPMGAAPAAYALWSKILRHNPANPHWPDRDRFVLSAGHGSTLLYSLLHLFGYGLSLNDLKNFRQTGSKTPGHPEYGHTTGVEATTGPLGQGIANAAGMALAEKYLAAKFNRPGHDIVSHYTFALCGDGCLMEGISAEAASLAGTLGLGKLIVLYDSNNITIEGDTKIAFRENVRQRFEAYGWHVQLVPDGSDLDAIAGAIKAAKRETERPSLIEIKTIIGCGAPNKQGKPSAHGEPLGRDEIQAAKANLGWPFTDSFYVPDEVRAHIETLRAGLERFEDDWNSLVASYQQNYPEDYAEWEAWHDAVDPAPFEAGDFWDYDKDLATRLSSEIVLNKAARLVPNLFGGSADLAPSTKTIMKGRGDFSKENPTGANLHFGIREHAMTAIANGIALHGGLRPYMSGFMVFSDYMKPAMRLSALMGLPVISVLTHDSIGVGEDGPTHQPVEQLASLRGIPGQTVIRPCDTKETAAAWYLALTRTNSPTAIALTRQTTKLLPETGRGALKGGYILRGWETPDIILMATGSEVQLIYEAYDLLEQKGVKTRVASMPSLEIFEEQPESYKESVLPKAVRARLAVEAGVSQGWHKYTGLDGDIIAIDTFGASGPFGDLFKKYGFTVENIVRRALRLLNR